MLWIGAVQVQQVLIVGIVNDGQPSRESGSFAHLTEFPSQLSLLRGFVYSWTSVTAPRTAASFSISVNPVARNDAPPSSGSV